ncbi:hypothetical protein [Haloarcula laminariae]|uniref:hypothetical protein n=1 Tax=Haloarcula laminariae TaxID=2961577 RepID=UPI002407089B|nr:hypothetical protein [Halomicroarcula sp. FL173]
MTTFNQTYFDFDEEEQRLDNEIADLQDRIDELRDEDGDNSDTIGGLQAQLSKLQSRRKGVIWARDTAPGHEDFPMWDEAADGVTLGAVRASTFGNMQNDLEADPDAGSGTSDILYVADGTIEAPYTDGELSDKQLVGIVGQLHPWYIQWASGAVDRLMDPEGASGGNGTH